MGIESTGPPKEIVAALAQLNHCTVFVETGTFQGGTTRWASDIFETVHTIERSESIYNLHSPELAQIQGVTPHLGDSREILPRIVEELGTQRAVYWLDGHWSGGETAGENDECPILDELASLSNRSEDIILIDDARLFLCAPPLPHDPAQWATISDIVNALPASGKDSFVQIVDDVIFIVPNDESLKNLLIQYAQERTVDFWKNFSKIQQGHNPLKSRLRNMAERIGRRITTR